MRDKPNIRGAVPVLVMPFDNRGEVDVDSMRRQLDFCVEAGSQAVAFGWGTESQLLTDAEREVIWSASARHLDGRLPVIAATTHPAPAGVRSLTRIAADCGVDAIMVDPNPLQGDDLTQLFVELSDTVGLPLVIQDAAGNAPPDRLIETARKAEHVICMKIEPNPGAPHKMGLVAEGLLKADLPGDDRNITIVGGSNGGLLLEELDRGSVGTLPHPVFIDAFRRVCDQHIEGNREGAWETYVRLILPVNRLVQAGGAAVGGLRLHKELFTQAGILRSPTCRIKAGTSPDWVRESILDHLRKNELAISHLLF